MRVIVLMNSLYTGGAEFSTLSFYGWLSKQGYAVKLVCCKRATPSYDPVQFGFNAVEYIQGNSFPQRIKSLNGIIEEFKPQLVHSVLFEANLLTRFCRIMSHNFVHLESLVNEMYSKHRLSDPRVTLFKLEGYRWLDKVTQWKGVDHFHANGESVARHYQDKLGINRKRITVVPRGRNANPFVNDQTSRERVRTDLQTGDRLLVMNMARHEYQKGQDLMLDALCEMPLVQDQLQLVLVGREGNYTNMIRKKIEACNLASCVTLLGHRNDVSVLLAAADVFIFPSRFEGLPGALIEAEAAGLPIICSDIPNNHEVAVAGKNALFFSLDDISMLKDQLEKLLHDKVLRVKMGEESKVIFDQKFLLEGSHQRLKHLLDSLVMKHA